MDDKSFSSIAGTTQETAEPLSSDTLMPTAAVVPKSTTPSARRDSTSSTKRIHTKRGSSTANSPLPSRESSPVRPTLKSTLPRTSGPGRSRKNSANDVSPSRPTSISNPPSAAAQQRALSATTIPRLNPVHSDPTSILAPVPQKPSVTAELKEVPRWPVSPRLRSPPPVNKNTVTSPRKTEQETTHLHSQKPNSQHTEQHEVRTASIDSEIEDSLSVSGMRTPARGVSGSTLETVQELSQPNTPARGLVGVLEAAVDGSSSGPDKDPMDAIMASKSTKSKSSNESGSESGGKSDSKSKSSQGTVTRLAGPAAKYSAAAGAGRGKPSTEGSTSAMTVETETVNSISQIVLGPGTANNGTIRTKPSSETIRPKKEKKKTSRKAPSVTSGTASSKADIFEAKVASAVDEANSSDSEETFVYESNPPDQNDRPRRYHSRTPSATSMASQLDQRNGLRAILDGHTVAMKKSMKFANSYSSNPPEMSTGDDDGRGTGRSHMGTGRGTTHHHHIGRWGRKHGNGHPSLFDNESPFPNAAKSKFSGDHSPRNSSQPASPRGLHTKFSTNGKKTPLLAYDLDDAAADDEQTPLLNSVRSGRAGRNRRPGSASLRQQEHLSRRDGSVPTRFAGCMFLALMVLVVLGACFAFLFGTTQTLSNVKILALKSVLASEQDLIFDMQVTARNPNVVVVAIDATDLVIFAKSKYAGTDAEWWKRPHESDRMKWGTRNRDDDDDFWDPFDPPFDDPDPSKSPNMEIGRVCTLDSPLAFEGSFFQNRNSTATGQIRINHPGNSTTPAGSERWGRVLQHEFELIVRGTLKYTLPFSARYHSISVEGRTTVKPNAAESDPEPVHIIA